MSHDRFYRPELDVLRLGCFLLVFVHHSFSRAGDSLRSALVDAGGFGVPVFFLLSSFLITELLLRERERAGRVDVRAFYARRTLRIWPLYFGFLLFCWTAGRMGLLHPVPSGMAASFLLMAGNWYFVLHGSSLSPAGVLWSISVEEQFYILWPWLMRRASLRRVVAVSLCMLLVSFAAIAVLAAHRVPADTGLWGNTLVEMQFFALGSLLAVGLRVRKKGPGRIARLLLLLATAGCWLLATSACRLKRPDLAITPLRGCIGYALLAAGAVALLLALEGSPLGRGRVGRPFAYLGRISYGLYVFHILMINGAGRLLQSLHLGGAPGSAPAVALALGLTGVAAAASYEFFERPFLRLKQRFTVVRSRAERETAFPTLAFPGQ